MAETLQSAATEKICKMVRRDTLPPRIAKPEFVMRFGKAEVQFLVLFLLAVRYCQQPINKSKRENAYKVKTYLTTKPRISDSCNRPGLRS